MAIDFYKDNKYPKKTKTNNNTERRENTYQPQTTTKKSVDNSSFMMYNKAKENTGIKKPAILRDITSSWKQKNENALKYAGDSAKKSVDAGLKEATDFMKDEDEGTKFEDVQTASVKWKLANDSNNKNLSNIAMKEMIGHLSKENKEPYLKDVQPLQTYIDAKDEFDYKNNNYTTTENIDTTPHESVRSIQRKLNEKGYTDKFGNKLKVDGIYGGKTAYALDEFEKNVTKNSNNKYKTAIIGGKEYQVEYPVATREDLQPKMLNNSKVGLADGNYEINTVSNNENTSRMFGNRFNSPVRIGERPGARETAKNSEKAEIKLESNTYINENGITKWKELPYVAQRIPVEEQLFRERKISTKVYNAFDTLSQRWYYADTEEAREEISGLAQKIRDNGYKITDCSEQANQQLWDNGQKMAKVYEFLEEPIKEFVKDRTNGYQMLKFLDGLLPTFLRLGVGGVNWYFDVKPDGKWDYKSDNVYTEWMPSEEYFLYYGEIISASDFGNINYGYTGTILGLTSETLYAAGGKVAPNPTQCEIDNYYSDSEVDHYWIKKGIEKANRQGYVGFLSLPVDIIFEIL